MSPAESATPFFARMIDASLSSFSSSVVISGQSGSDRWPRGITTESGNLDCKIESSSI